MKIYGDNFYIELHKHKLFLVLLFKMTCFIMKNEYLLLKHIHILTITWEITFKFDGLLSLIDHLFVLSHLD